MVDYNFVVTIVAFSSSLTVLPYAIFAWVVTVLTAGICLDLSIVHRLTGLLALTKSIIIVDERMMVGCDSLTL